MMIVLMMIGKNVFLQISPYYVYVLNCFRALGVQFCMKKYGDNLFMSNWCYTTIVLV